MNPKTKEHNNRIWFTDGDNPLLSEDWFTVSNLEYVEKDDESFLEFDLELLGGRVEDLDEEKRDAAAEYAKNLILLGIENAVAQDENS